MLYQIIEYIKFLFASTNKYGVHSPFVYNLITVCFNKKTDKLKQKKLQAYMHLLSKSSQEITVIDFGAGSRVFKNDKRVVSNIVKHVAISEKQAKLLIRLGEYLKINTVLEIGTSLGVGTLALALGNKKIKIATLEGCSNTIEIPKRNLKNYTSNSIQFVEGDFSKTLSKTIISQYFDLVYFDGNHQKQSTIDYFELCLKTVHNETVFIFDDIYWSKGMTEAWNYIKNHPKVTLTVDTYDLGFVFFRKEQFQTEHFKIRM